MLEIVELKVVKDQTKRTLMQQRKNPIDKQSQPMSLASCHSVASFSKLANTEDKL